MKTILLCMALVGVSSSYAQSNKEETPQLPIALSGEHFVKAANNRTASLLCTLGAAVFSGIAMTMDEDMQQPAFVLSGGFLVVGVGFNISAIGHERKAGKIMQGK